MSLLISGLDRLKRRDEEKESVQCGGTGSEREICREAELSV